MPRNALLNSQLKKYFKEVLIFTAVICLQIAASNWGWDGSLTRQRWLRSPSLHILAIYVMPVTVSQNRRPLFASSTTHGAISGKVRVIAREEVRLLRFY
ncbi:hypothetical protein SUGI_1037880 [Cryptomeria japonica]|nr:hypothetical protein SUGI_1037880 [Cryptomeria japonica]